MEHIRNILQDRNHLRDISRVLPLKIDRVQRGDGHGGYVGIPEQEQHVRTFDNQISIDSLLLMPLFSTSQWGRRRLNSFNSSNDSTGL